MMAVAFTVAEPHHDMSHEVGGGVLIYWSPRAWPSMITWKHFGMYVLLILVPELRVCVKRDDVGE
jgi:hypothetical protein